VTFTTTAQSSSDFSAVPFVLARRFSTASRMSSIIEYPARPSSGRHHHQAGKRRDWPHLTTNPPYHPEMADKCLLAMMSSS
jgi:hypothetical protein